MAADCANSSEVGWIPRNAPGNREGIHLWGSLTYEAFDETCRDVDCIAVARRDLQEP